MSARPLSHPRRHGSNVAGARSREPTISPFTPRSTHAHPLRQQGARRHRVERARRHAAAVDPARQPQPHRHQVRLRHGAVRRVHGATSTASRRARARRRCPRSSRASRSRPSRASRRSEGKARAGRVGEARRAAVRLLPVGPDHVGHGAAREEQAADRRGHRRRDGGQRLPLRDLRAHPRRDPRSGQERSPEETHDEPHAHASDSHAATSRGVAACFLKIRRCGGRRASRSGIYVADAVAQASGPRPHAPAAAARAAPLRAECVRAHRHATTRSRSSSSISRWARAPTPACRRWSPRSSTPLVAGARRRRARRCVALHQSALGAASQGTGGSTAIANSFEQYRQAGAAARAMLVAAAARAVEGAAPSRSR